MNSGFAMPRNYDSNSTVTVVLKWFMKTSLTGSRLKISFSGEKARENSSVSGGQFFKMRPFQQPASTSIIIIKVVTLAVFWVAMFAVGCSKGSPEQSHHMDTPPTVADAPPTVVDWGAVEITAQKTNQFSFGVGRGCAITGISDWQPSGQIAVKLVLLTTNTSVNTRQPQVKTETLETTLLAGQSNVFSFGGILFVLTPKKPATAGGAGGLR